MRPAPDRILPGGIPLLAAFDHVGPARALVHNLKYRGLTDYAALIAGLLAPRLPRLAVVPVPRALSRRLRYGIDPARVLATALARALATRVIPALAPPVHARRRAGGDHAASVPVFRSVKQLREPVFVVDDVVTTGSTLRSACAAIGPQLVAAAVAANTVSEVTSLRRPEPSPGLVKNEWHPY